MSGGPVDRRSVLTGVTAAVLASVGIGRALTRSAPSPDLRSLPPTGAGEATTDPSAAPAPEEPTPEEASPAPAAATAALVVPVLCREAWGAAPAGAGLVEHELARMTVHHTAVPLGSNRDAPGRLRQHQRYHQSQDWPDIAYHLGVDRHGNVYELRDLGARGDTFTDYDPSGHLLLLAEGDFDQQQPTDAQLEGLAVLLAWGADTYGLPIATAGGHRDHASTSCPGDALYERLPDLRRRAAELAGGGVSTRSVCGEEGRATVARIEAGGDG